MSQLIREKEATDKDNQKKQYKIQNQKQSIKYLEEELAKRDQEMEQREKQIKRLTTSNDELKKENASLSSKLKQIQTIQMKELNRKIQEKDSEIDVLKEMVKSGQLQIKGKEQEMGRLRAKIQRIMNEGVVDKVHLPKHLQDYGAELSVHDGHAGRGMKKSKSKAVLKNKQMLLQATKQHNTSQGSLEPPQVTVGFEDVQNQYLMDNSMNQEIISNHLGAGYGDKYINLRSRDHSPLGLGGVKLPEIPQSNRHQPQITFDTVSRKSIPREHQPHYNSSVVFDDDLGGRAQRKAPAAMLREKRIKEIEPSQIAMQENYNRHYERYQESIN